MEIRIWMGDSTARLKGGAVPVSLGPRGCRERGGGCSLGPRGCRERWRVEG